ncbi:MAG: hypothetical protein ABEJ61_00615 [Haloferacaceae archaeon]
MDRSRTVERERAAEREPPVREGREPGGRLAGLRSRLPRPRLPRPRLSIRAFLVATAVAVAGVALGGLLPVLGGPGRVVGLFVATFGYGLVASRSHYLAVGVGGAVAAVLGVALNAVLGSALVPLLAGYGPEVAGVGATVGALVAVAGHYFGRDLRGGLTREL